MKYFNLIILSLILNTFTNIAYSANKDFTQGFHQSFQTPYNNNFNRDFSNPNSYMNKSQYTGTSQIPMPAQHNIFNYDTTRYNSNCQFGVCMPGGH